MIYALLVVACLLTIASFLLNRRDYIAPSFVFCAVFTFAIAWAAAFADSWNFELHANTFWVIAGGMTEYVVVSAVVQSFSGAVYGKRRVRTKQQLKYIYIPTWKKLIAIFVEVAAILGTVLGIVRIMSASLSNAMVAITQYRDAGLFFGKTMEALPWWVGILRLMATAMGYWFMYVYINNMLVKKHDILTLIVVVLAIFTTLTTGARGDMLFMLVSAVAVFVVLSNKKTGFRKAIKIKTVLLLLAGGIAVLFTLKWSAELIGRTVDFNIADYIAIYCGAEIMNLDIFLQEYHMPTSIWGGQTFINIVPTMGQLLGFNTKGYSLILPFRSSNGYELGNVYTTFYPYIYDFGYMGVVVLVGLMALFTQWNYECVKRVEIDKAPPMSILVFEYIIGAVFFSFFSNKFYEYVANETFLRLIIIWVFMNYFHRKVRIKQPSR